MTHTGVRDITPRWSRILSERGLKVAVLKADTVSPEQREAWVAKRVEEGIDVLMCHPRLVQTGLDLVDFPTICWAETDYSVYTMRQASRRSWRIGQTQPVRVVFLAYRNTIQADGLKLVAKKLTSSLAVEGELSEDGLAAYGDDGDDLMLTLAHQIAGGLEDEEPVEEIFQNYRTVQAADENYLVDDDWDADRSLPEPPSNGSHSNGHRTQETRPAQLSLADFLSTEPAAPAGSARSKPAPASQSLFDWAVQNDPQEPGD